jgi:outer membrane protein OmpA-like peptidoglycan-associated protein
MAWKPSARRIARISPLVAGTLLASALAPSAASAQYAPDPEGNGALYFSSADAAKLSVAWPAGDHVRTPAGYPASQVGSFSSSGARLTLVDPAKRNSWQVAYEPVFAATEVLDPDDANTFINGMAAAPYSNDVAIATDNGVTTYDPESVFTPVVHIPTGGLQLKAGRIQWVSGPNGGPLGTLVWDATGLNEPPSELAGAPTSGDSAGTGIWIREENGAARELITDPSAADPSVSNDGRIIAYTVDGSGGRDIFYVNLAEGPDPVPHALEANTPGGELFPTVSPDGKWIAYLDVDGQAIRRVAIDGSGRSNKVADAPDGVSGLAWRAEWTPILAGDVKVTGTPEVGQTLTAAADGDNTNADPADDQFRWEACDDLPPEGPDPSCLSRTGTGTNGASYTVAAGDVGKRIRAIRVARAAAGEATTYSTRTAVVTGSSVPVDTQGPEQPTLDAAPAKKTNKTEATFDFSGAEVGGRYECFVADGEAMGDGPAWQDCTSPATFPNLTEGVHTFYLRQVDDADNPGQVKTYTWEIDTTEPAAPALTQKPSNPTIATGALFEYSGTGEQGSGLQCRIDPLPTESEGVSAQLEPSIHEWHACASPQQFDDLAVGPHRFQVRERDAAGNYGPATTYDWTINAAPVVDPPVVDPPVVTPPVVEPPVQPTPVEEKPVDKPAVETPAPVVQTPAVEAPKAEAPKAEEPKKEAAKPVVTPVKPPALTAVIGGTKTGAQVGANGGTSAAATIEVAKESVGVGCSITGTVLKSCKVDLYAPKASGARARAAAAEQVLVGTGTYESKSGSEKMDVRIELNATGKAMLRKNPGGLKVTVKISGQPVSGAPLKATGVAKLVTDRAAATVGGFAVDSAVLTPAAKRQLRQLAKFGTAATVRCVGHTDGSTDDARYLRELGRRRAKAVCAFLAAHGMKVGKTTLVSKGSTQPLATNATKAGRAANRRVQVTLVR